MNVVDMHVVRLAERSVARMAGAMLFLRLDKNAKRRLGFVRRQEY